MGKPLVPCSRDTFLVWPRKEKAGWAQPAAFGVAEDHDRGPCAAGAARWEEVCEHWRRGGRRSWQLACGSCSVGTGQPPQGSPESITAKKEDRAVSVAIQSQLWDEDSCTTEGFRKD